MHLTEAVTSEGFGACMRKAQLPVNATVSVRVAIWGGGLTLDATGVNAFGLICRLSAWVALLPPTPGGVPR